MNRKGVKILAVILSLVLVVGAALAVYAANSDKNDGQNTEDESTAVAQKTTDVTGISKDETVYIVAGADGAVKKIIVSDWIKNAMKEKQLTDRTDLTNIEGVKGDETYTVGSDNSKVWDVEGNDIYYKGDIQKELPVGLTVSYKLNGQSISAEDLAGKSGRVTIRFDYQNHQYERKNIEGKTEIIYVPFAMLTGMLLDTDKFTNVEVSNGRLVNDGSHTAVIGIAFPGLQENLGISKKDFDIPDYVEITADVKDFETEMTMTVATNELFNEVDTSALNRIDSLKEDVEKLNDAMNQLINGSSQLYDGLTELLNKSGELVDGVEKMAEGAEVLKDATTRIDEGAGELRDNMGKLADGLAQLAAKNDDLTGGAKQIFDGLLATAQKQLTANGLEVPELTISTYSKALDSVIASLDETTVYNKALKQVTAAVEEKRPVIEEKVTETVREKVYEKVIEVGTEGKMDKKTYELAKKLHLVDKSTQQKLENAVEEQMNSAEIKATIAQNVEEQVQKAIADNMTSDAVQDKLRAASEGAKSVIELKASLDGYCSFYLGLLQYTDGVATCANGAEKLYGGAGDLKDGTLQVKDGFEQLYDGIISMNEKSPALVDGVSQLKDGSMQLSDGLKKFNEEGIKKITDLINNGGSEIAARVKATVEVSKNYKNFAGISEGMDGQVKFIYKTDEIKAK